MNDSSVAWKNASENGPLTALKGPLIKKIQPLVLEKKNTVTLYAISHLIHDYFDH
jgi:hypothetical protein